MKIKRAILQVSQPACFDSLVIMLRAVGIEPVACNANLRDELRKCGLDTVNDPYSMAQGWGGNCLLVPIVGPEELLRKDVLYVDAKAHRNGPKLWLFYPHLEKRALWYRINGARPCIVPGKGDELNPPCPVLTPDPWYDAELDFNRRSMGVLPQSTLDKSYSRWPPFERWDRLQLLTREHNYGPPICLTHNLKGWGYGDVGELLRKSVGLKCYGGYGSPDGLYPYAQTPELVRKAVCLVHLKSQDCPGYSLYEAMALGVPLVLSRMLIDWCKMHELFVEGETCLCFDVGSSEGGAKDGIVHPINVEECAREAAERVEQLRDPALNAKIGLAGKAALNKIMWSPRATSSLESLTEFLQKHFG